jgi:hypothetical protein
MRQLLALGLLFFGAASAGGAKSTTWTWNWCSQDGKRVVQVTGVRGENFYQIKIDGEKPIRLTEDELDGGSGILPGSQPHYGEDGHSDGFNYEGRLFRSCD